MTEPQSSAMSLPQANTPNQHAVMAAFGRFKEVMGGVFKEKKPWSEFFDRSAFARPANFAETTGRMRKNAAYFRVNYIIICFATSVVCLLVNPTSLLVLAFLAMAWIGLFIIRTSPIVIGGRTFSEQEKFIGMAIISLIVIFFITNVATVMFWALGLSLAAIALHGSFRVPDDLFTDEVEGQTGLLGFFTAPTSTTSGLNAV